jgi:hypothetical protein
MAKFNKEMEARIQKAILALENPGKAQYLKDCARI